MRHTFSQKVLGVILVAVSATSVQADLVSQEVDTTIAYPLELQTSTETNTVLLVSDEAPDDQRLASIESRLAMIESNAAAPARSCQPRTTPSTLVATNSIGCPSTYAGFDFAILKANVGGLGGSIIPLGVSGSLTSTFDYEFAPRFYIGRERADGLGARLTYFQFDHSTDPSQIGVVTQLEVQSLDLEATNRIQFCGSDLLLSAGLRYGKLAQDYEIAGLGSLGFESEGAGLTIGGRYTRDLGRTGWDMIIGGRASILATDNEIEIPGLISVVSDESTMKVWEAQIGVRRSYDLSRCANLIAEFTFETQNWDAAPIAGLIGNDVSLFGPAMRLGLTF